MEKRKRILGLLALGLVMVLVAGACSKKTPVANPSNTGVQPSGTATSAGPLPKGGAYRSAIEDFGFTGAFDPTGEYLGTAFGLFSQLLIAWGQLVQGNAIVVLSVITATVVAAILALRQPPVRAALGDALWRVPALGERLKVYQLARFYRTTGMLLKGGMPLVGALGMAAELLHPVLRERLVAASRAISEGHPVSESLDANGLATPVALRMLTVGDRSGTMGDMMERIAGFHDEELARWVDWFTRLFEPVLMALIGLVIGAIVILMYMPIFELAGNLQ